MATYRLIFEVHVPDEYKNDFESCREVTWLKEGKLDLRLPVDLENDLRWEGHARMVDIHKV